jgi:two-component system, OmpR family, sensor kinase
VNTSKKILLAVIIYGLNIALLFGLLYWYLSLNGFSRENFILASGGLFVVSLGLGYLFVSDLLFSKEEMDYNLSRITKEILHELNIPLTTIQANTAMLARTLTDEKSRKRLSRIEGASQRLHRLYEELVYAINKEIHTIEKEPVALASLLTQRVEYFKAFARNPFVLELDPLTVRVDKIGLEQIIDNLISNAMKYSDKNTPITLTLKASQLTIEDQGIGMDEGTLVKIFERYYQADRRKEGEGIGLALVKSYCDSMRIDIQIRSRKLEGTSVTLEFGDALG